jgi:hypothetical protein
MCYVYIILLLHREYFYEANAIRMDQFGVKTKKIWFLQVFMFIFVHIIKFLDFYFNTTGHMDPGLNSLGDQGLSCEKQDLCAINFD